MKTRWRPFIQQLQQKISKHLSHTPLPVVNTLWIATRAESLVKSQAWVPVMTPEQEASYADESWVNSPPRSEVQVHLYSKPPHIKDSLYKGSLDHLDMQTSAAIPAIKPNPQANALMSHLCGDTPDRFAAIIGTLIAPTIQDKNIVRRVPTKDLHTPKPHITGSLRPINITDPYLSSVQTTPNHEFAIVPRQKPTAQLPPRMRLHEDISDSPEDLIPVETLVNAAILTFHNEQGRLPHKITIAAIRYWRYRISINTFNPDVFYYDCAPIPITHAPVGDLGINEVRLD